MPITLRNPEIIALAQEIADISGESVMRSIVGALKEKRDQLVRERKEVEQQQVMMTLDSIVADVRVLSEAAQAEEEEPSTEENERDRLNRMVTQNLWNGLQ